MRTVRVQAEDFDAAAEARALTAGRADVGALVSFVGLCRDEGGRLAALEIEHYPGMAEAEIARVVEEACERWPLIGVTAIHRFGTIAPGEPIVLVVTASAHRIDGSTEEWVEPKSSDDRSATRWGADAR